MRKALKSKLKKDLDKEKRRLKEESKKKIQNTLKLHFREELDKKAREPPKPLGLVMFSNSNVDSVE